MIADFFEHRYGLSRVSADRPHHASLNREKLVMAGSHQRPSESPEASRRDFLQAAGAVAAAASVSPMILHASDKAGTKAPVLGTGAFQYEVVSHNWGEVPDHIQWGETHGVAVDEAGRFSSDAVRQNTESVWIACPSPRAFTTSSNCKPRASPTP